MFVVPSGPFSTSFTSAFRIFMPELSINSTFVLTKCDTVGIYNIPKIIKTFFEELFAVDHYQRQ